MELAELTTRGFSELLASDAPAPGGGSAAALEGALGAALIAMVCRLTADKPRYREHRETVLAVQEQAEALRARFLDAMERDTEAFRRVSDAFALPKATEEEKAARSAAIQRGMAGCMAPPLEVMDLAAQALDLAASLLGRFNENSASDLGVAALSLRSGLQGAWLNVLINAGSLKDRGAAEAALETGRHLLARAMPLADKVYDAVASSLL